MPLTGVTRLGPYEILAPLGSGGMGEVYRARDSRLGREVAIKLLPASFARDPERVARFEREARTVAALNHPHIVVLYAIEEHEGLRFLAMELVEGHSLDRDLPAGGMPAARVLEIGIALADALSAAHDKGVVHRDLKPGNVMLTASGTVKVLDFGLAKPAAPPAAASETGVTQAVTSTTPLSTVGQVMGTVPYMAPEQIRGEPVDARTDLFALGVVLYELATGRRPFTGATAADVSSSILRDAPPPLARVRSDLPRGLERIIGRLLEKSPAARYPSAREVGDELRRLSLAAGGRGAGRPPARVLVLGALVLLAVAAGSFVMLQRQARLQWAKTEALPRIRALSDSAMVEEAWALAQRVRRETGDDRLLEPLWPRISRYYNIRSQPPGARVSRRAIAVSDTTWTPFGTTPLDSVRAPIGGWYLRLEKPGFEPLVVLVVATGPILGTLDLDYALDDGKGPRAHMARVAAGRMPELNLPGLESEGNTQLDSFWVDVHEITNAKFKAFVDAGGYRRRELWTEPFVLEGRTIPWEAAMARFIDRTGRPGPSTWEAGDFPAGQQSFPVAGVSWYEANAYAKFAGKSLPTVFHWVKAARTTSSAFIVPRSNLAGNGPAAVGTFGGIGPYGTFDMAGNVREWCLNAGSSGRHILGGGWNDPGYAFNDDYTQPAFDRSPTNGIRLVSYAPSDTTLATLSRPITEVTRDFAKETPVGDAIFAVYLRQFEYDRTPLNPLEEPADSSSEEFVVQRVTYAAAYGNERVIGYLFLPKRGRPPYQTVVVYPGSDALAMRTPDVARYSRMFDFMVKSGRAVFLPVFKSTWERGDGFENDNADQSIAYRDHVIMWAKDLRRSIDWLETRRDLDSGRIAYYGLSWGGLMGGMMPATEPRIRSVILYVAGLAEQRSLPEVEVFNYLPRVRVPVLMLNGRFDHYFPVESSQRPFFERLGTPAAMKRHVIADGGHFVPRNQLIAESLDWLDRTLGPVR